MKKIIIEPRNCSARDYQNLKDYLKENSWDFQEVEESTATNGDLFEQYDILPHEVQLVLMALPEDGMSYEDCTSMVNRLEQVGYTCDYGLDAVPHSLKKVA